MRIVIVSPNSLLTLRGSEQFVLETASRLSSTPGVETSVVTFRRKYAIEDLSRLAPDEVRARTRTIHLALGKVPWTEFRWLSQKVFLRGWVFDQLNRRMEFVPPGRELMRTLRRADRIYFVTWRTEDLLSFLPVAFLSGRKHVVAGIHSRMRLRRPEIAILSLWHHLGVLRGFHTIDSGSTRLFSSVGARVTQVPNGVDCERFRPGAKEKGRFVVLFAGSAHPAKGVDLLPAIHAGLQEKGAKDASMWICTSDTGVLGKEIREWSKDRTSVDFKGWVTRLELADLYRRASALLMPSRREVQSLSSLEAQASGTPVISSDLPSFRNTIEDGRTGFIVRKYKAEDFVEAIMRMRQAWSEGAPYELMCKEARENAVANYSSSLSFKRLLGLLASS